MSRWWRAEDTSIDHPKLLKLSDAMHRAWYTLMCVASANHGVLPPAEDIAVRLRVSEAKVAEWITKLVVAKLFDNVNGVFVPHNWTKRQYKSDKTDPTAPERMKRYRQNKKRNDETDTTDRNNRNADVTQIRPEAEAKAESETEQSRADASAPIDEDLKRRASAIGAGVSAHFLSRQLPVPNLDRCLLWLTQGYAQGTILTAIEIVLKRGTKPATLEYFDGAIRDAHAKAVPPAALPQLVASQEFIIEGTPEWVCWDQHLRATTGRDSPVTDSKDEHGRHRRGWWRSTKVPPGYDEATGEKLETAGEERVA